MLNYYSFPREDSYESDIESHKPDDHKQNLQNKNDLKHKDSSTAKIILAILLLFICGVTFPYLFTSLIPGLPKKSIKYSIPVFKNNNKNQKSSSFMQTSIILGGMNSHAAHEMRQNLRGVGKLPPPELALRSTVTLEGSYYLLPFTVPMNDKSPYLTINKHEFSFSPEPIPINFRTQDGFTIINGDTHNRYIIYIGTYGYILYNIDENYCIGTKKDPRIVVGNSESCTDAMFTLWLFRNE